MLQWMNIKRDMNFSGILESGRFSSRFAVLALAVVAGCVITVRAQDFQGSTQMAPFDEDTIAYNQTKANDPLARLQRLIDSGEKQLKFDAKYGYLPALLKELNVKPSSQMLVFSKTSLQRQHISPENPRALYFNDDVYIGWIPGAPLMELSGVDPKLGGVFYALEQRETARPRFVRTDQCLECHASSKTMGVPGHLMRSFMTDEEGNPDMLSGTSQVNHRTPIEERWGGWYVSGTHGNQLHRGNLIGKAAAARQEQDPNYQGNITNLNKFFDTGKYLEPASDIVALMVLEHETHMHNFITRLHFETSLHLAQYKHINYLHSVTEGFLKYLLFVEEAPITSPIKGVSSFAKDFLAEGPKDKQGRSLRDLDLEKRLFKYPCSFLIYSDAFNGLPQPMKERVYLRLKEILTGEDKQPDFQNLTAESKRAIYEILLDTKPDFRDYVKTVETKKVVSGTTP